MNNIENLLQKLIKPSIKNLVPYSPPDIEDRTQQDMILLDFSENNFNFGDTFNRYPEQQPKKLIKCLSDLYDTTESEIILTRGIDDGLDLLIRAFCESGKDSIIICPPAFCMYKVWASIQDVQTIEIPLLANQNFSLDITEILKKCENAESIKLIFLCSPNNPTGNLLKEKDILHLCKELQRKSIVILDEAYVEFASAPSLIKYIKDCPNLVITRTLSKAYGLASERIGSIIAHPQIIEILLKIAPPYAIPLSTSKNALKRLKQEDINEKIELIKKEREKLKVSLSKLNFVKKVFYSEANFLLIEVDDPKKLITYCEENKIYIRDRSNQVPNCVRISVGNIEENYFLLDVLKKME